MEFKKAFTLSELLISLGIIGAIALILTPIIGRLIPNHNVLMAKKTYNVIQKIVTDLINDDSCYPDISELGTIDASGELDTRHQRVGFANENRYPNCIGWQPDGVDHSGDNPNYQAGMKFATLFLKHLDIDGDRNVLENQIVKSVNANGVISFQTKDGVYWKIANAHKAGRDHYNDPEGLLIYMDMNGPEKPNIREVGYNSATTFSCTTPGKGVCTNHGTYQVKNEPNKDNYDVYTVGVKPDGTIIIRDPWAQDAIDVGKNVTSD